jgi:tripartite-type tricarboxylate transporter receptor subunit TctC
VKIPRRQFLHLAAGAAALPAVLRLACAQTYPSRPVRIIVGFAPGGGTDITARIIGQWLSERLGQPFLIENRAGAAGNIATEAAVNARPDGYTLLMTGTNDAINATLYETLKFNFIRDIVPVASMIQVPNAMLVLPSFSAKTIAEFIAYAKANPGKINMGSGGTGTMNHMCGELFKMMAGIDLTHVPYRGGAPALTDLLGGQIQVFFAATAISIEYIKAGRLRALAVTSVTRSEVLPTIPTVGESLPGYEASTWWGLAAPKNTPAEIIHTLNQQVNVALGDPKMRARLADLGGLPIPMTPEGFSQFIAQETEKWGKVIRAANIKPQ